jgi:hypothetical protein
MKHWSPDGILVAAQGYLCMPTAHKVLAVFSLSSTEEFCPCLIEVQAMREFFELVDVSDVKTVQVQICDLRFRCKVMGYTKKTCQLQLLGASFFRGVARALTARSLPLSAKRRPRGGRSKS